MLRGEVFALAVFVAYNRWDIVPTRMPLANTRIRYRAMLVLVRGMFAY